MKRKFQLKQILLFTFLFAQFANLYAQKDGNFQTESPFWGSMKNVPYAIVTDSFMFHTMTCSSEFFEAQPATYAVLEIGFNGGSEGLCEPQHRFVASGGFYTGQKVYWDPGLTAPLVGTLIMNPADGKIYTLSGGVIGSFTGDYCY